MLRHIKCFLSINYHFFQNTVPYCFTGMKLFIGHIGCRVYGTYCHGQLEHWQCSFKIHSSTNIYLYFLWDCIVLCRYRSCNQLIPYPRNVWQVVSEVDLKLIQAREHNVQKLMVVVLGLAVAGMEEEGRMRRGGKGGQWGGGRSCCRVFLH